MTVIFFSLVLDLDVDYLHFSPTGQALRANLSARDRRGFEPVAALRLPLSCNNSMLSGSYRQVREQQSTVEHMPTNSRFTVHGRPGTLGTSSVFSSHSRIGRAIAANMRSQVSAGALQSTSGNLRRVWTRARIHFARPVRDLHLGAIHSCLKASFLRNTPSNPTNVLALVHCGDRRRVSFREQLPLCGLLLGRYRGFYYRAWISRVSKSPRAMCGCPL